MERKDFTVTEKAGEWVAGQRSPGANKAIALTEDQARYALIAGEIVRGLPREPEPPTVPEAPPAPPAKPRK